jgi:hypothetical protein
VTAGSCFAQHIARYLRNNGFNYLVAETALSSMPAELAERYSYGMFSARYANIYTTRQLVQLFDRAYGVFDPEDDAWRSDRGWHDPFRPFIQPGGFTSREELAADREGHLRAVRRLFEQGDCFIFTLGLTECWESVADGAILPACPGTSGIGFFDPDRYRFRNFTAAEVAADLSAFVAKLRGVNAGVKIILTVSPVPLIATMEDRSVIVSTAYSKAVLRVAAEEVARGHDRVAYFPSYEIITSNYSRGSYYADDLREVREAGVSRVMGLFLKYYCGIAPAAGDDLHRPARAKWDHEAAEAPNISAEVARALCDEVRLEDELPSETLDVA